MDLRQMEYAIVLAEELNFRKAAERLNMTQPPLSRQIKSLEDDLGILLFERGKGGVSITPAGKFFIEEAKEILRSCQKLRIGVESFRSKRNHRIKIGFIGLASIAFIPELAFFLKSWSIDFELKDYANNEELLSALADKSIDIAFHYPTRLPKGVSNQIVFEEPIVLIMNKEYPLNQKQELTIEDFAQEKYILSPASANPLLIQEFHYLAHRAGFVPNIVQEVNTHQARLNLVAQGLGITFDGKSVSKLGIPNLVYKKVFPNAGKARIAYAWRTQDLSAIHDQVLRFFSELNLAISK